MEKSHSDLLEEIIKPRLNVSTDEWYQYVLPAIEEGMREGLRRVEQGKKLKKMVEKMREHGRRRAEVAITQ